MAVTIKSGEVARSVLEAESTAQREHAMPIANQALVRSILKEWPHLREKYGWLARGGPGVVEVPNGFIRIRWKEAHGNFHTDGQPEVPTHSTDDWLWARPRGGGVIEYYAIPPKPDEPFVTVQALYSAVAILFPPNVPKKFREAARLEVEDFKYDVVKDATLQAIKAKVLSWWHAQQAMGTVVYVSFRDVWEYDPDGRR